MEDEHDTSSLQHRRKKSSMSITACFHRGSHSDSLTTSSSPASSAPSPSFRKSPSSWFKSNKHKCHELPDLIKSKRRNLMSRMSRHRRHASADFHYDPLSYALNFEDDDVSGEVYNDPNHNFVARLPVTPPRTRPIDELARKIDVMDIKGKGGGGRRRGSTGGELSNNVFEVRTPREKVDPRNSPHPRKSPRSPSNDGTRNFDVSSPRVAHEILA